MKPMLCTPVKTELELQTLLSSEGWVMQQKLDGHRILSHFDGKFQTVYNRKGESSGPIAYETQHTGWIDGEMVNGTYYAFDFIPEDQQQMHWADRQFIGRQFFPDLTWINYIHKSEDKRAYLEKAHASRLEGVVFKRIGSYYEPGRRSRNWCKYKFVETADVIVRAISVNGPLSIGMAMIHDGHLIDVGTVKTQPEVLPNLTVGTVIEVKYLYATSSHRLYQPVWGSVRTDKDPKECTTDQLKYTNKEVT